MLQLSVGAACAYVRKCLDEIFTADSEAMIGVPDDLNIRKYVEQSIIEATVKVHNAAPTHLLVGEQVVQGTDYIADLKDGVVTITFTSDVLRLISMRLRDSEIVVNEFIPEDSPEGRKQLNEYIRGVPDDPKVVILKKWKDNYKPRLKYYTTEVENLEDVESVFIECIPYPTIEEQVVLISHLLEYAVLNELVAMILENMGESDKAALYRGISQQYLQ